jgi:hypothetical protein
MQRLALAAVVASLLPLRSRTDEWLPPGWKAVPDLRGSGRLYYWDMATNRSRLCAARSAMPSATTARHAISRAVRLGGRISPGRTLPC